MGTQWDQHRALITGGAGGIGRATALRLLEHGAKVAVWDFNSDALGDFTRECGERGYSVHSEHCDISDKQAVAAALERSVEAMGGLSILVNNAGYVANGFFEDREFEAWSRTISVNLESLMHLSYVSIPHLRKSSSGHIINLSSAAGVIGTAGLTAYSAAKWAVWGFSEALRQEFHIRGDRNLHIGTIHPGYLKTGMFEGSQIRGLGGLIVPGVKSHDHVARAIVSSISRKTNRRMLPRSVSLAVFFRAIFPDSFYQAFLRFLGIHRSMDSWKGKGRSIN